MSSPNDSNNTNPNFVIDFLATSAAVCTVVFLKAHKLLPLGIDCLMGEHEDSIKEVRETYSSAYGAVSCFFAPQQPADLSAFQDANPLTMVPNDFTVAPL